MLKSLSWCCKSGDTKQNFEGHLRYFYVYGELFVYDGLLLLQLWCCMYMSPLNNATREKKVFLDTRYSNSVLDTCRDGRRS